MLHKRGAKPLQGVTSLGQQQMSIRQPAAISQIQDHMHA